MSEYAQTRPQGESVAVRVSSVDARERDLIARINAGEKELFYELVQPYERQVYITAFAILRNEADAKEVAQDAVLKAFEHLWQFRLESKFSTWLIRITVNEARMRRRKNHPEVMAPLPPVDAGAEESDYTPKEFPDWRELPSEALERTEIRQLLIRALGSLAQIYREVFVLRDVQHLSIEETSRVLGISIGAVKTRLLRARLMLRDFLAPELEGMWNKRLPFEKGENPWM